MTLSNEAIELIGSQIKFLEMERDSVVDVIESSRRCIANTQLELERDQSRLIMLDARLAALRADVASHTLAHETPAEVHEQPA